MGKTRWKVFAVLLIVGSITALVRPIGSIESVLRVGFSLITSYVVFGYAYDRKVLPDAYAKPFSWVYTAATLYYAVTSPFRVYENIQAHRIPLYGNLVGYLLAILLMYFSWLAVWA